MSIMEPPPAKGSAPDQDATAVTALLELRDEVRQQGKRIRATQAAFSLFAVVGLIVSLAMLLAVAIKLDRSQKIVTVAAPAAATPQPAATPAVPTAHNVDVTLAQFAVSPSLTQASAGKVTFRVHNAGTITHEFVVIKTDHAAADLPIKAGRADEAGNVGETGDLKAGSTKSVTIPLAAGHYALICNLPGHYLAGQHTDFSVK